MPSPFTIEFTTGYLLLPAKPGEGRTGSRSPRETQAAQLRALLRKVVPVLGGVWGAAVGNRDLLLSPVCLPLAPLPQKPLPPRRHNGVRVKRGGSFIFFFIPLFFPSPPHRASAAFITIVNVTCCCRCFLKKFLRQLA